MEQQKMITCHMIGNAHLDPVWLWSWREGFQENKATMLSALQRLDEFDDFIFTSSSAQFYEWIEENEPALFARIRQMVRQGRWILCGGWWVQPDCNLPSGEAFVRQALLAQNYFLEKFGVRAHTGYCVDSFGHHAMLPQLLRRAGMERYVFMRPGEEELTLPDDLFLWQSPDGSAVTAYRLPLHYGFSENLEEKLEQCVQRIAPTQDSLMFFYGVGNHGGGPTVRNLMEIQALQQKRKELRIVFSSPDAFFEALPQSPLPVVHGDLHAHAPGCYAANSEIKRLNRMAENRLLSAEKMQVLAAAWRGEPPMPGMDRAWKQLLLNQFHDTLAGTTVEEACFDIRNQLGEALSIADRCQNQAIQQMSFHIGIAKDENALPVVVFNPHSWTVRTPVELESGLFPTQPSVDGMYVTDSEGRRIAHQRIPAACTVPDRARFTFLAEVPPLGYAVYVLHRTQKQLPRTCEAQTLELENDWIRVRFSEETGAPCSVFDKRSGKELLGAPAYASVLEDLTDTWGHSLKRLDRQVGRFAPASMDVLDDGPVRKAIRVVSRFGASELAQTYCLYTGDDKLTVHVRLNWQEKRKALKFCFPLAIRDPAAICEIPFGFSERSFDGVEETMQRWADVSGADCGMSLLNDGKYSVCFTDTQMQMTVTRSPAYAHHDPCTLEQTGDYAYLDRGLQRFCYQLKIHGGDWRKARTVQDAALLNQPAIAMYETFHDGPLPLKRSALAIEQENILLSALKPPYRGEGCVLRLYESWGVQTTARISLFCREITVDFAPFEVKTLLLRPDGHWREVDFMEWDSDGELGYG